MTARTGAGAVIVVGSANQDWIVRVPAPPGPGETVLAESLLRQPGGKGANQAVAAARLHGDVSFVACVGDDADGSSLVRELRSQGVDTGEVEITDRGPTGLALVWVHESGENSITVVPGANSLLTADRVTHSVRRLAQGADRAVVLVQAEVTPEIITATLAAAEQAGARAVLNLAPYLPLPQDVLATCDPLVLNENEASSLVGWRVDSAEAAGRATEQLRGLARSVVITIGARGACWADPASSGHVPAPVVEDVVDTTGAGDAFVGALACYLAGGEDLRRAVGVGVLAGSFAVRSPGAQSSYPVAADLGLEPDAAGPATARATGRRRPGPARH